MENHELVEIMHANRLLRDEKEFRSFEKAFVELVSKQRDPGLLSNLLLIFDDATEQFDTLWGVLHYIEQFETSEYIPILVETTQAQTQIAKSWLRTFYIRILNHDPSRSFLKKHLLSVKSEIRNSANEIIADIANGDTKNPELRQRAESVLS